MTVRTKERTTIGTWGLAALSVLFLSGCAASTAKYVKTERLEIKEKQTKEGTSITAEAKEERAETNVIEQSTNVKTVTKITQYDAKDKEKATIGAFAVSPDGATLVMPILRQAGDGFVSQLWATSKNGGAMTKVTSGNYRDIDPRYSKDGNQIYFVSNRGDARPKIWRIRANGLGGLTKVTSGSTLDRLPSPSPDGERIVYQSLMEGDGRWQIWTSTTSGTLPTQMTLGHTPSYSPDGKKILFLKPDEKSGKSVIWYMDADGANQTQLTQGVSNEEAPSWSPDGNYILFASDAGLDESGRNNLDIYLMKADGTGQTQLTTNGSVDTLPLMDPDGKYVYFVSNRGGAWNVWRMELATDVN